MYSLLILDQQFLIVTIGTLYVDNCIESWIIHTIIYVPIFLAQFVEL